MGELVEALCSELAGARGPPSSSVLRPEAGDRCQESYSADRRKVQICLGWGLLEWQRV